MESVYPPKEFECTEKIDWKKHFQTFNEELGLSKHPLITPSTEKQKLDLIAGYGDLELPYDKLKELEQRCSVFNLTVEGECNIQPPYTKTPRKDILKKIYLEKKNVHCNLETVQAKLNWVHQTDLGKRRKFFCEALAPKKSSGYLDLYPGRDMLITVRVYQPFPYIYIKDHRNFADKVRCSHELVILGSQTVQNLKDKLVCENEKGIYAQIKDLKCANEIKQKSAKDVYPSSFIFIDDVFYCDMRHENAVDTSKEIREWAKARNLADFGQRDMSEVKLEDLKFRIGYPYLYQHVADCEHILIFCDVRLITKSDPLKSQDYPYISSVHRNTKVNCSICDQSVAVYLLLDGDRLPNSKMHLCEQCFKSYNFIDGEKVGDFKAYPFFDRSTVL